MIRLQALFRTCTVITSLVITAISASDSVSAGVVTFGSGGNAFNMDFTTIGSPGNAADTTGDPNPAGAVSYAYQLGTYEVREDMITKFNASQSLQITKDTRGVDKPATSVSWNEAARFVNWLNTSTGGFAAYNATGGVNTHITPWTIADTLDYNASNPYRSLRTNFVLPSMDEWYKAAYFDPNSGNYFNFPNGSDTAPMAVASGTAANTAVYGGQSGPADVNQAGGLSPFGIMGLGGNVWEWEETAFSLNNSSGSSSRGIRGGDWSDDSSDLSSGRLGYSPADEFFSIGFRVASLSSSAVAVPEPSSWVLSLMGLAGWWYRGRRRK